MEWYYYLIIAGLVALFAAAGVFVFGFVYRRTLNSPGSPMNPDSKKDSDSLDPELIFRLSGMEETFRKDDYDLPEEDFMETGEETEFDEITGLDEEN